MAYTSRTTSNVNPYTAGNKTYGGGRSMPNVGPVDRTGYKERDAKATARRNAVLRRMKAQNSGKYASPDAQREV